MFVLYKNLRSQTFVFNYRCWLDPRKKNVYGIRVKRTLDGGVGSEKKDGKTVLDYNTCSILLLEGSRATILAWEYPAWCLNYMN